MPPRAKFTREDIVNTALELVRADGMSGLSARALAAKLGSSVKPIFGMFENMEALQFAVLEAANARYQEHLQRGMEEGIYPPYKASGMAYIDFARQESELFKLLFMRDRSGETTVENRDEIQPQLALIQQNLGISADDAYLFHMQMWIYVHGIATMVATSFLDWDDEFVSKVITDAYLGLKYRYVDAAGETT